MTDFKIPENPNDTSRVLRCLDTSFPNAQEAAIAIESFNPLIIVDPKEARCPSVQICLLTIVNLVARIKSGISDHRDLGNSHVLGVSNQNLSLNFPCINNHKLSEAVKFLGGNFIKEKISGNNSSILIGNAQNPASTENSLRCIFAGWQGGVAPADTKQLIREIPTIPISPIYSAALAVSECFRSHFEAYTNFGKEILGVSFWDLEAGANWHNPSAAEPALKYLPNNILVAGLGHLGQAYIWALSMLPYGSDPNRKRTIKLLDMDSTSPSNLSTSMLTFKNNLGQKKTRIAAQWAEAFGFETQILEGRIPDDFLPTISNQLTFCGFDNLTARLTMADQNPKMLMDGGLGTTQISSRQMTVNIRPSQYDTKDLWRANPREHDNSSPDTSWNYGACGQPPGIPAVPFSGVAAAAILISEILRRINGGKIYSSIRHSLLSPLSTRIDQIPSKFTSWNPSFSEVSPQGQK